MKRLRRVRSMIGHFLKTHMGKWRVPLVSLFTCLLVLFVMALPCQSNAADPRDKNPPEIKALIGMQIPDKNGWGMFGDISPEWKTEYALPHLNNYVISEIVHKKRIAALVVSHSDPQGFFTVVDAVVLPFKIMSFSIYAYEKFGWPMNIKDLPRERYQLFFSCDPRDVNNMGIVGLARAERGKEDCLHYTRRIKQAWRLDPEKGRLEEVPTKGVSCYWGNAEDECAK